ncbi:MAG TPA: hypothetical protein VMR50_06325 [Myxococcota bacterium]|nr:hypothetical protein [Myxococcota bacterium]
MRRFFAALSGFMRGFVGAPAHAPGCTARAARESFTETSQRRGRCC